MDLDDSRSVVMLIAVAVCFTAAIACTLIPKRFDRLKGASSYCAVPDSYGTGGALCPAREKSTLWLS